MKQSRIDFIKEAHSAACSKWQKRIEDEFPKLFPKEEFKVGDWVVVTQLGFADRGIGRLIAPHKTHPEYFMHQSHTGSTDPFTSSQMRKATKEEIEAHLIAEAKKRGFVKGAKIKEHLAKNVGNSSSDKKTIMDERYKYYHDDLYVNGNLLIYFKGQ